MRNVSSLLLTTILSSGLVLALPAAAQNDPSGRKAECRKQATDKGLRSGPERRDFMRECVHGKGATPATPAQPAKPAEPAKPDSAKAPPKGFTPPPPDRKASCAKEADQKALRGPDRRDFMRGCMGAT